MSYLRLCCFIVKEMIKFVLEENNLQTLNSKNGYFSVTRKSFLIYPLKCFLFIITNNRISDESPVKSTNMYHTRKEFWRGIPDTFLTNSCSFALPSSGGIPTGGGTKQHHRNTEEVTQVRRGLHLSVRDKKSGLQFLCKA